MERDATQFTGHSEGVQSERFRVEDRASRRAKSTQMEANYGQEVPKTAQMECGSTQFTGHFERRSK